MITNSSLMECTIMCEKRLIASIERTLFEEPEIYVWNVPIYIQSLVEGIPRDLEKPLFHATEKTGEEPLSIY